LTGGIELVELEIPLTTTNYNSLESRKIVLGD